MTMRSPAPANLVLKEGAQVMFLKNSLEHGFVNGTMGEMTALSEGHIGARIRCEKRGGTTVAELSTYHENPSWYDRFSWYIGCQ